MLVQARELFHHSLENKYMTGAFNVFNFDTLTAVVAAAEAERSPVIIQVSMGARKYAEDFRLFLECIHKVIETCAVPVLLQHDHCSTFEACREAIEWGIPAVMFDGSHLRFEENIERTRELAGYAHARGVWVEAELGSLPGFEDEVFSAENKYTEPDQAARFIEESGCDALAVAVGTSHGGVLSDESLPLAFDRLAEIHAALPDFPLVLHGGASLEKDLIDAVNAAGARVPYLRNASEADVSECRRYGVCKVNMDVDNFMAYTTAVLETLREKPDKYDPRVYLRPARDAFKNQVRHKMRNVLRSSDKAGLFAGSKIV
ncbi:class II fructose-bisphosphate aldolase [Breznakiella homolactica]|uniref:Class II fructose-bisphosphate aldolase n=1 Tax=Breznakiella homolactica TaxID=2798577 RepID=A0A7T7XPQ0_9SPIR|nr:class II fructose-bisphosphate aldolase [Breznakiella homolactica]QQO10108.1 class II fructose-bisphosphate aldolase [Breznakiella homolactica]